MVGKSRANLRYYLSQTSTIETGFNLKPKIHQHHINFGKWRIPIRFRRWSFEQFEVQERELHLQKVD